MPKDIRVLIVEDDPYARDLMAVLLTRDWRTRVVGEAGSLTEAVRVLDRPARRVDVVLLDTENPADLVWPFRVAEALASHQRPAIVCSGTRAEATVLQRLLKGSFQGYLLKNEIGYALASAVCRASEGQWVATSGIRRLADDQRLRLPDNAVILNGALAVAQLTARESEVARLAILLNFAQRDLADELHLRSDSVARLVSQVYHKLGVQDIIAGDARPEDYFEDESVLEHVKDIVRRAARKRQRPGRRGKAPEVATLAFHLLTTPVFEDA